MRHQLSAGGWVGPDALDVKAQGAADMRLLASFLPGLERTGGQLFLDSEPGKGTRFCLQLPLAPQQSQAAHAE